MSVKLLVTLEYQTLHGCSIPRLLHACCAKAVLTEQPHNKETKQALDGLPITVPAQLECNEALTTGSAVQQMLL